MEATARSKELSCQPGHACAMGGKHVKHFRISAWLSVIEEKLEEWSATFHSWRYVTLRDTPSSLKEELELAPLPLTERKTKRTSIVGSCPIVEYNVIVSAFVMLISCLASSIMKMKVASASGTSVDSQQTMHLYISEDLHLKKKYSNLRIALGCDLNSTRYYRFTRGRFSLLRCHLLDFV